MRYRNYTITYKVFSATGTLLKRGEVKVKNRLSEIDAKFAWGTVIEKRHGKTARLEISKCEPDLQTFLGETKGSEDFMKMFKNILK